MNGLVSVLAMMGCTVLRFGVPILGIWLLSALLKRIAPVQSQVDGTS